MKTIKIRSLDGIGTNTNLYTLGGKKIENVHHIKFDEFGPSGFWTATLYRYRNDPARGKFYTEKVKIITC